MNELVAKLWKDDRGALIATEFLFVATILVIGLIVGLSGLRAAVVTELTELGNAILALSQGYSFQGVTGCCATTDGSEAVDSPSTLTQPLCTPVDPTNVSDINVIPCG